MAYIQVELMAIEHAEFVSKALGCKRVEVLGGLVELWQFSWKRSQDIHQTTALQAWFDCDPGKTVAALEAFGFVEDLKNGTFRVKGAERYLRIRQKRAEAGKKGGLKRAENAALKLLSTSQAPAKQVPSKSLAIASDAQNEQENEAKNQANAKQMPSKSLASAKQELDGCLEGAKQVLGNTEHRTQNTEHRAQNMEEDVADATGKRQRSKAVDDIPPGRLKALTDSLVASWQRLRNSKYLHAGGKDAKSLKELARNNTDAEIVARWERGIVLGKYPAPSNFAQLLANWNALDGRQGISGQVKAPKPKPISTAEALEKSLKEAKPLLPLKERNPKLWAENEARLAAQREEEKKRQEEWARYDMEAKLKRQGGNNGY